MPSTASPTPRSGAALSRTWSRYGEYLREDPLLTVEWSDPETEARGWLVINSLRGGASGGGTRMRPGLGRREVVYLAKTMELKFAFSGPHIGGAKSGIDFDPADPRRAGVLRRWFRAVAPYLRHCYGTGGDLNVDEVTDVIPCCAELGLRHPQEGIVRGHLRPTPNTLPQILDSLDRGVKAPVSGELGVPERILPLADLITGYGVARSISHAYRLRGQSLEGVRVLVEGFGAVGGPCALYLAREGARIVGIADRDRALIDRDGLDGSGVADLLRRREGKALPADDPRCLSGEERRRFLETPAEVFVSAAVSGTLDTAALSTLEELGVTMLACGANQPFREASLGATKVQRDADRRFTVIADVVANCGMARTFSLLMDRPGRVGSGEIFSEVDRTIAQAIEEVHAHLDGEPRGWMAAALALAMDRIADGDGRSLG